MLVHPQTPSCASKYEVFFDVLCFWHHPCLTPTPASIAEYKGTLTRCEQIRAPGVSNVVSKSWISLLGEIRYGRKKFQRARMEKSQRAKQAECGNGQGGEKGKGAMPLPRPHLAHSARRNFFGTAPHQGALPLAWCLFQTIVSLRDFFGKAW